MNTTFFFYDLETSGLSPRSARIMQFAGQRTDQDLKPIGEPVITEAEFLKIFHNKISLPNTIFVGYNTIRFDDEFMRFLNYRNFYDPYEWQWQDGRSRWDLLDVVRMTRALRPEGITWFSDSEGKAGNRLEQITTANNIPHSNAHDALADVNATIAVANLIHQKQPKQFNYLLDMRQKKHIAELALSGQPFIYTSGKYPTEFQKTTVVKTIAEHPRRGGVLVYDLRFDPTPYSKMSVKQLVDAWKFDPDKSKPRLPVKTLQYNRCPAVAPFGVLDKDSQVRVDINPDKINENEARLSKIVDWPTKILDALAIMDVAQEKRYGAKKHDVDESLYEGFFGQKDRQLMTKVHQARDQKLINLDPKFDDQRLNDLYPLYKARNFPDSLTIAERESWDKYRLAKLMNGKTDSPLNKFKIDMKTLTLSKDISEKDIQLLKQLELYSETIIS